MPSRPSVTRRILHGVISGGGFTVTNIVVNIILIRLVLDALPRDLSGVWFLFLSFGLYLAYFDLGVSPTLSREMGFLLAQDHLSVEERNRGIADLIATCVRIFQAVSAAVFFLGLGLGGIFLLKIAPEGTFPEIAVGWAVFTVGASLNILGGAAFAALYGTGNVATERLLRSLALWLWLVLSGLALHMGFGIIGLATAWVSQNLLARLVAWAVFYRYHPELRLRSGKASVATAKRIAVPSLKWAAIGLGALLIIQTDIPIIAALFGPSAVPAYEAAAKAALALMTFSLLIVTSSTPFISRAYAARDMEGIRSLLTRNVRFGMAVMIILVSFLAVFGDTVITRWLGPGNFVGFAVLWTLLAMLTLEAHHVIHASAVMAAGHIVFLRVAILAGIMKIVFSVILARYYGVLGVPLGTLIAQVMTNNWYVPHVSLNLFGISASRYVRSAVMPLLALLVLCTAVNWALRLMLASHGEAATLLLSFSVSGIISVALVATLLATKEERARILGKLCTRKTV